MPRMITSLASNSLVTASPAEYHALRPSSPVISARVGRATPNQGTYFRTTHQKRSEEHTSELQSHSDLVCRLLLEKKKTNTNIRHAVAHKLDVTCSAW